MNVPKSVEYFVANPAGNITIFVTTEVSREFYQETAARLLALKEHNAEQVGFIKADGSMEMCGLEFCGNASRSFALYKAKKQGIKGEATVTVSVSGSSTPLEVFVNTDTDYTKIEMPKPLSIKEWHEEPADDASGEAREGVLVDLGGIMHLVLWNVEGTQEIFDRYKEMICERFDPPAMGVMFYETETGRLTPVVYVRDVDTTYFEGSCGSGSTAVGIALSCGYAEGEYGYKLIQPAGDITCTVLKKDGSVEKVFIEGPVELGKPLTLEL